MTENNQENLENASGSSEERVAAKDMSYEQIVGSSVGTLFKEFQLMSIADRMKLVTAYCLAKAVSGEGVGSEEVRLEYLKEFGRNERSMLKSDVKEDSDDDPLFSR